MNKNLLAFFFFLSAFFMLKAQVTDGQKTATKVTEDNFQQLQVCFTVGKFQMNKAEIDGRVFTQLNVDGMQPSLQVGAPNLPTWSSIIEVPVCSGYQVEVSGAVYDTVRIETNNPVMPLQPSYSKSDRTPHALVMDERIYSTDAFFSAAPIAIVEHVGVARDRNLARLQFSPVSYNPVRGLAVVCRRATVTVRYTGSNEAMSMEMFNRYNSPLFGVSQSTFNNLYPKAVRTAAPVRYLIVAHSMFRGQLDNFINWKRRKGFITDIVYTDDAAVGTSSTSISNFVKSQYTNATTANPAPTYVLIVGDNEQIPAFSAQVTSPSNDHITDLYYVSWTSGDHIPDCYIGRFSAQSISELTPQIEKTLMYEQYTFADPSFLDRAVMVAGVDRGSSGDNAYTYGDPAMDYAVTNYVNGDHGFSQVRYFKNDLSIVPNATNVTMGSSASSNSATVRSYYNQGAGWINYSAHGSETSWGTPSFTTSDALSMTNSQKFGVMIGNCCLTNSFQVTTCLGESVLRKGNYCGAVGYIGGSNSTYWGEDFYWAVGVRSGIGPTMSMAYNSSNLGSYDRLFHTHNEAYSNWATSQGSIVMLGNMSVESSGSSYAYYYWEIYHLMGDPSLMPYLTQAQTMNLTASSVLMYGTNTLTVTAAPYAYVALTDTLTHTLKASGFANASGSITLTLPSSLSIGGYELAASAQQYRTAFQNISVIPATGAFPTVVSATPTTALQAGSTVPLTIKVANLGNSNASGVSMTLTSDNPLVTLSTASVNIGSIAAGDTVTITTVSVTASQQTPDATNVNITAATNWSGSSTATSYVAQLTVNAPAIAMTVTPASTSMLPDSSMYVTVTLTNNGHANLGSSQLTITSGNSQMTIQNSQFSIQSISQGASVTRQFRLHASHTIDTDIYVPIYIRLNGSQSVSDTLQIYIGINFIESFEGGNFQVVGWTQGNYPWAFTSEESYEGSWSARSTANLGSNNTSELSIIFNVASNDSISYYYKVSSEDSWDKFHCFLDGTEMRVASGEIAWTRDAFPVSAGNHTLLFTYTKDGSVDRGSDCAWIDKISLPHGARSTSNGSGDQPGGGTDEPGTFENLVATFDNSADDSQWTLLNGALSNAWTIGTTGANGAGRGLYISNDGGQTNAYTANSPSVVFAYTTIWLDAGDYNSSFDWRCNGEGSSTPYDYMRAALVPTDITLTASSSLPTGWSYNTLPSGAIALDGGNRLNLSSTWSTREDEIHVSQSGWYNYVFLWRNDNSVANNPPAAVDNVRLFRNVRYTLNVTASHGTTTGSGTYLADEVATIGVYPEAGYTFVNWSDGNTSNPRQLTVNSNRTISATLSQGNVITVHDTTVVTLNDTVTLTEYVNVPVHDTTVINIPVHDTTVVTLTEYVEVPVHDTTVVTINDTVTLTEIVIQTDTITLTEYVEVPVHDTTVVTLTDTVTLTETVIQTDTVTLTVTEYVPVHDTTVVTLTDTLTITETVVQFDTVTLTDYVEVPVHDTTYIYSDTVTLTEYVPVHDTIYSDTVTLTEYVTLHDTTVVTLTDTITLTETIFQTDTLTVTEYVPIHDTTIVTVTETLFDTVMLTETIIQTDTLTVTEYVPVYDTTIITVTETLFDTITITETLFDTITLTDTLTVTEYVPIHDTTVVTVTETLFDTITMTDTLTVTEYVPVHDTTIVTVTETLFDTVTLTETVILTDTLTVTEYVPVHDTTIVTVTETLFDTITLTDTLTVTEYVPVHDTTIVTVTETLFDTITLTETVFDTINNFIFDTTVVTDTLWVTDYDTIMLFDTLFFYDTIIIHDTIYVTDQGIESSEALNLKIYANRGQVVVDGADGGTVTLFDVLGRILATKQDEFTPLRFDVPASGTYMIKVGDHPARKVVVIK